VAALLGLLENWGNALDMMIKSTALVPGATHWCSFSALTAAPSSLPPAPVPPSLYHWN
jgi:hypothetical protein